MKAYILTEADFENLLTSIDRDPMWGHNGGSSAADVRDPEKAKAHEDAHAFYNHQLRKWIDKVKA